MTSAGVHRLSRPLHAGVEEVAGEPVHRYSLGLEPPRSDVDDPLLAALGDHLRRHGIRRLTFDVWLGTDGALRQTREHAVYYYSTYAYRTGVDELYQDHWDFGAGLPDLSVPPSEAVPRPESDSPRPGLRILIDGRESSY
ncbi:hypothetical protein ACQP1W_40135 [Spirillospora sp. CA-255316]